MNTQSVWWYPSLLAMCVMLPKDRLQDMQRMPPFSCRIVVLALVPLACLVFCPLTSFASFQFASFTMGPSM